MYEVYNNIQYVFCCKTIPSHKYADIHVHVCSFFFHMQMMLMKKMLYVWGTVIHWYSEDQFENVNQTHFLFPKKPILATEATVAREKDPTNPDWSKGEHYAHDIMGDLNNWVIGFIDWNLMLDFLQGPNHAGPKECEGRIKCGSDAMLLADTEKQVDYPQVFYYYTVCWPYQV